MVAAPAAGAAVADERTRACTDPERLAECYAGQSRPKFYLPSRTDWVDGHWETTGPTYWVVDEHETYRPVTYREWLRLAGDGFEVVP